MTAIDASHRMARRRPAAPWPRRPARAHRVVGFTMLELAFALAATAVLAAIAWPMYTDAIARGHRAAARHALADAAVWLEGRALALGSLDGAAEAFARQPFTQAPATGRAVYRLELDLPPDRTGAGTGGGAHAGVYLLKAVPVVDGPMRDDACGTLRLDGTGRWEADATDPAAHRCLDR